MFWRVSFFFLDSNGALHFLSASTKKTNMDFLSTCSSLRPTGIEVLAFLINKNFSTINNKPTEL